MENKSHALAAGAFVLAMLALLIGLAVWLTRDNRVLRVYELSSPEAVTGLQPQASVRYKGVNVGKVMAIGFDPQNRSHLLIRIAIDERPPITHSTFATLGFQGITGLAFVQLDDSGESQEDLVAGTEPPPRIAMRPSLMAKLTDRGEKILIHLEESSLRINQLLSTDNQNKLMSAIGDLGQAAAGIAELSNQAKKELPQLVHEANVTLKTMKETSVRVGLSADDARASAKAFKVVSDRMTEKGGTLEKMAMAADVMGASGQTMNIATLPRMNRAAEDAAQTARQVSRAADTFSDNPQSLLFGIGTLPPGPGEPGFSVMGAKP
jgi:phospholipid/cholesterol/gamma-HCH transport system substrate-binding protein